jgi:integrase
MAVEYRKDRKKWGYRVYRAGHSYKKYAWLTKTEAREAERAFLVDLKNRAPIPKNTLAAVASAYLIESARKGRSQWRLDGLRWNFQKWTLPHFGENTLITAIRPKDVEEFALKQKQRGVSNKTVWNLATDLRAMFNYALKEGLVRENPVNRADLDPIRNRKPHKPPLNLEDVDRAASVLQGAERVYFDFLRFSGLRKDEANRVKWEDVDLERGWLHVRGSKTEESDNYMPIAPALLEELCWLAENGRRSEYVFPGSSRQTNGKKIYSRRRLFEKIERFTSRCLDCGAAEIGKRRHCQDCKRVESVSRIHRCSGCKSANVEEGTGCVACDSGKIRAGVKLRPKDLRDYFASEVAARVTDPNVIMRLLRHTSLTTTTKYLRTVKDRIQEAVKDLGAFKMKALEANLGGKFVPKTTQNDISPKVEVDRITSRYAWEKFGGGGRSRTADAADMSRVL